MTVYNLTEETCTGTGDVLTLTGAVAGHRAFGATGNVPDGAVIPCAVEDSAGALKVWGQYTFASAGNTLTRSDTESWNGSAVDNDPATNITLSGGTHTVRCAVIADELNSSMELSKLGKRLSYTQTEIDALVPSDFGVSTLERDDGILFWSDGVNITKVVGGKINTGVGVRDVDMWRDLKLATSSTGLFDFVLIADSNGLAEGGGWAYGILEGLRNMTFNLYGTPILAVAENGGSGLSIGTDRHYVGLPSGAIGAPTGAPQFCEDQFGSLDSNTEYAYVASGNVADTFFNFRPDSYGSTTGDPWTARLHHATFASGGGVLTTDVRMGFSPYTQLASDDAVDCATGKDGFQVHDQKFNCSFALPGDSQEFRLKSATLVSFCSYMSAFKSDAVGGFSCSILANLGGWALAGKTPDTTTAGSFYQNKLLTKKRENIGTFFRYIRERQVTLGKSPSICITLSYGMNDRSANSIAEFKEKLALTYEFMKSAYMLGGGAESELSFILMPSHRVSDTEGTDGQADLTGYSGAADELALGLKRVSSVNLNALFTETEAITNSWYASGGADHYHLTNAGSAALWERAMTQVFGL